MAIELSIDHLPQPSLQFGGATQQTDPKVGLEYAGPFDLRFGSARGSTINVGLVGTTETVESAARWLERCSEPIPFLGEASSLNRSYPSFAAAFHKQIQASDDMSITVSDYRLDQLSQKLTSSDRFERFQEIVDIFADAMTSLAKRDANRPDVVLVCLPKSISLRARTVDRQLTRSEKKVAQQMEKEQASRQLQLFDLSEEVEQTKEDMLKRDLRDALKARALDLRLPIQIATASLTEDSGANQEAATRAWNFSVALYYKAGGVPWRLPVGDLETCFVGVSFHHFRTTQRHVVHSSLAQAFSSEGEGFAIRGEGVPADPDQRRNTKLTEPQAFLLGTQVLHEYRARTGHAPLRLIIHKTSEFVESEICGFRNALREIPIVSMVTLMPSSFRLLRFGSYPPNIGTVCTVNDHRTFLYTSGYMPALETYPGPHIPQPFEIRCFGDSEPKEAVQDVLNLTRMNWNTADIRGKWPVTLSFARRVGGILDEFGDEEPEESSLRYFI